MPPKGVWQNINVELDRVASKRRKKRLVIFIPSLLGFVALIFIYLSSENYSKKYALKDSSSFYIEGSENTDYLVGQFVEEKTVNKQQQHASLESSTAKNSIAITSTRNLSFKNSDNYFNENVSSISDEVFWVDLLFLKKKSYSLIAYQHNLLNPINANFKNKDKRFDIKKTSILAGYSFTNSTLINNDFYKGFDANSLIILQNLTSNNFSFGFRYKLSADYSLTANFGVANSSGQKYATYIEGNFLTNELNFKYNRIALGVDKRLSSYINPLKELGALYLNSGVYFSNISSVELTQSNSTKEIITNQYSSFDVGLSLGLSIEIPLSNHLKISPQIESSVGLLNLFKGDDYHPSGFNKTQTLSFSPGLFLSYSF